jgi:ubiquinone/menaquinone biosynthesis C-methylase UbiE
MSAITPGKKILDVGCGWNKIPGALGLDANPKAHADIVHDLGAIPYPFPDNEFDEIVCRHVVEHVPDVMALLTELYRIAKPGAHIPDRHAALHKSRLGHRPNASQSLQ